MSGPMLKRYSIGENLCRTEISNIGDTIVGVSKAILVVALLATPVVALGDFTPPQKQDTGLVGLAAGQTARFSVLYPGIPAPVALVGVAITLVIEDDQGNTLATQDFLLSGALGAKSASLSINADSITPPGRNSILIHAYTLMAGYATGQFPLVIPGLDIVDNTNGKTVVHLETRVTFPLNAANPAFDLKDCRRCSTILEKN